MRQEGQARFNPGTAFYRVESAIARDLAILCARLYRQSRGQLRVLDTMTGSGVRPLRYVLEAQADWVWANEGNMDLAPTLRANLAVLPPHRYQLTHENSQQLCLSCYQNRDFYDLVDIDNFGNPATHIDTGLGATRLGGLLYLTNTDGRSTSGHDPQASLRIYPAYARWHPAVHEQGLRLLLGRAAQTAASRGLGIEPLFSLFTGRVHRVMVRLVRHMTLDETTYGFVAYCHGCGHFQRLAWSQLGRVSCPCQLESDGEARVVVSGPLWIGPLHDVNQLLAMATLAQEWGWLVQTDLLALMAAEANLPPYYYPLGEIGRRGRMDIPNRDRLVAALQSAGYQATRPHMEAQAVKTTASFSHCVAIARQLSGD